MSYKHFRHLFVLAIALPFTARAQTVAPIPAKIVPLDFSNRIPIRPEATSANNATPPPTNAYGEFNQRNGIVCAPQTQKSRNSPLIILDGRAIADRKLQKLNPNDIENIIVVKGEQAISVYGSSGENGVLIITTKRANSKNKKGHLK
ncbi:hypothetical protein GCM10027594_10190 [Hymenobacter agri]